VANEMADMPKTMYLNMIEMAEISIDHFGSNCGEPPDDQLAVYLYKIATTPNGKGVYQFCDISRLLRSYRLAALQRAQWQERLKEPS
jgi:hypothetical protein